MEEFFSFHFNLDVVNIRHKFDKIVTKISIFVLLFIDLQTTLKLIIFLTYKLFKMKAYVFPGQGAQFTGMGKDLYESSPLAKELFEKANDILGFRITDIMFEGTAEELKETKVTQPAVFLHSVILAKTLENFKPEMVAGHSLGEFSALVANGALSFEDALLLVSKRALAMQKACEIVPSTMAAVLNLEDKIVEDICASIDGVVVAANYNCPGQLVISGEYKAVELACEKMKEAGAKRALILPDAKHSDHCPVLVELAF